MGQGKGSCTHWSSFVITVAREGRIQKILMNLHYSLEGKTFWTMILCIRWVIWLHKFFGVFFVFWIFISELQCTEKAYLHLSVWCRFARKNPRRLVPASVLAGMCKVRSRLQRPTMQRDEITSEGRAVLASRLLCRYSLRSLASLVLFFPH